MALTVDALVGLGVAAELVCCLGVLTMRGPLDRLHYAAAGTTLGPALIASAVCVEEGFLTSNALNAIVVALLLVLLGAVLTTATGRIARKSGS